MTRHDTTREVASAVACFRSQPTWLIPNYPFFYFLRHFLPLRCPTLFSCPIPCLILCSLITYPIITTLTSTPLDFIFIFILTSNFYIDTREALPLRFQSYLVGRLGNTKVVKRLAFRRWMDGMGWDGIRQDGIFYKLNFFFVFVKSGFSLKPVF